MPGPIRYRFVPYWYGAVDSPSEIDASVTREPRTFDATLAGSRYCYEIVTEAEPPSDADGTGASPARRCPDDPVAVAAP